MLFEYKDLAGGAVKDIDLKKRRISGYLSAFGNKDNHGDIIAPGAFTKTLRERKDQLVFLNQHNWAQPHGPFDEVKEDSHGLAFVSAPLIDTTYSMDVMKLYEAGIMREHSIGFITVKSDYDKKEDARIIKEIKLYEGSNVTMGANSNTPFTGFKSSLQEIKDQTDRILKAFRNGTFSDETFTLLEIALKQLQAEAVEYGKSLREPSQPTDTPPAEPIILDAIKQFNQQFI